MSKTRRLPLWKNCLDTMRKDGLEFGKQFTAVFFEDELSAERDTMRFDIDLSRIRNALLGDGFYLSGEGHKGNGFEIIPAADNHKVGKRMLREAVKRTNQTVRLLAATPLDRLTASERLRHQQMLERAQTRQALIASEKPIIKYLQKTAPDLLKAIQQKADEED